MAEITLVAELGRTSGSSASRRLRKEGKIPGVLYGHGMEPLSVSVQAREFRIALSSASGSNQLLSLEAGGTVYLALARDMQRHPVRNTVTHVDFQIVGRDELIATEVPVVLTGEALEVMHGDGMVDQQLFTVPIKARPADIPTILELDITNLTIGGALRVSDLVQPDGVTFELEDDVALVIAQAGRSASSEQDEATGGTTSSDDASSSASGSSAGEG